MTNDYAILCWQVVLVAPRIPENQPGNSSWRYYGTSNMKQAEMNIRRFDMAVEGARGKLEAVCVECGADLIAVIGGGERYHCGALGLTLTLASLKDADSLTHSTYQIPVPGHKEEALAREGSLLLARRLGRNVVLSVGIHEDDLSKEGIQRYSEAFYVLVERIGQAYEA